MKKIEGQVDILIGTDDYDNYDRNCAWIVFEIDGQYVEGKISRELLKAIDSDFEGAQIILSKSKKKPLWARKDKEMEKVLKTLEKIRKV